MNMKFIKSHKTIMSSMILILLLVGFIAGHEAESISASKTIKSQNVTIATLNKRIYIIEKVSSGDGILAIKQWGVKLPLPSTITNATYVLNNSGPNGYPTVYLSTAQLDNSPICQKYYSSATVQHPSFQWLERYGLSSIVYPDQILSSGMSAQSAATQYPTIYKQIGNYVYGFGHASGVACPEESIVMLNAFQYAFQSLTAL